LTQLPQLTEAEFEHIEETIARTAKGRAFLRRYQRRASGSAEIELRCLLEDLRGQWQQQLKTLKDVQTIDVLRRELVQMAESIEQARREVAALRPPAQARDKILTATNELDAIVTTTERASFDIITSAERLLQLVSKLREGAELEETCKEIETEVTAIFTACSFQDLTGQRTNKVISAIRYLEQRINAMISLWEQPDAEGDFGDGDPLLRGPALDGEGVSQSDVDRLFGEDTAAALSTVLELPSGRLSPAPGGLRQTGGKELAPAESATGAGDLEVHADGPPALASKDTRAPSKQAESSGGDDTPTLGAGEQSSDQSRLASSVETPEKAKSRGASGIKVRLDGKGDRSSAPPLHAVGAGADASAKSDGRRDKAGNKGTTEAEVGATTRKKPKSKRKESGAESSQEPAGGGDGMLDQSSIDALFD